MDRPIRMELLFVAVRTGTTRAVSTKPGPLMPGLRLLVGKMFSITHCLKNISLTAPPNVHMFEFPMVTTPDEAVWMIGGRDDDLPVNTFKFECASSIYTM